MSIKKQNSFVETIADWHVRRHPINGFRRIASRSPSEKYEIQINDNSFIHIFCDEVHYVSHRSFNRKINKHKVFYVYSVCSDNVPQLLKQWFSLEITLPNLLTRFSSSAMMKKAAIEAYLLIVLQNAT